MLSTGASTRTNVFLEFNQYRLSWSPQPGRATRLKSTIAADRWGCVSSTGSACSVLKLMRSRCGNSLGIMSMLLRSSVSHPDDDIIEDAGRFVLPSPTFHLRG
jgi:hypothetical protein